MARSKYPYGGQSLSRGGVKPGDSLRGGVYQIPRVRVEQLFASNLPPRSFLPWERKVTFPGTTMTALSTGSFHQELVAKTQNRRAVVLFDVEQAWYDAGLDPLDPDSLAAFQDDQNVYGRYVFNLFSNGEPLWDASERLWDLNAGAGLERKVNGFSKLNTNLLGARGSAHATAVVIEPSQKIIARWTKNADPGHVPSTVGVTLSGWSMPYEVLKSIFDEKF